MPLRVPLEDPNGGGIPPLTVRFCSSLKLPSWPLGPDVFTWAKPARHLLLQAKFKSSTLDWKFNHFHKETNISLIKGLQVPVWGAASTLGPRGYVWLCSSCPRNCNPCAACKLMRWPGNLHCTQDSLHFLLRLMFVDEQQPSRKTTKGLEDNPHQQHHRLLQTPTQDMTQQTPPEDEHILGQNSAYLQLSTQRCRMPIFQP